MFWYASFAVAVWAISVPTDAIRFDEVELQQAVAVAPDAAPAELSDIPMPDAPAEAADAAEAMPADVAPAEGGEGLIEPCPAEPQPADAVTEPPAAPMEQAMTQPDPAEAVPDIMDQCPPEGIDDSQPGMQQPDECLPGAEEPSEPAAPELEPLPDDAVMEGVLNAAIEISRTLGRSMDEVKAACFQKFLQAPPSLWRLLD